MHALAFVSQEEPVPAHRWAHPGPESLLSSVRGFEEFDFHTQRACQEVPSLPALPLIRWHGSGAMTGGSKFRH